jgi:co-chaperonin GroES (HSP10)
MQNYQPVRKDVLIQAFEWPEKSTGGIYFPSSTKYSPTSGGKDPWRGKILAVGDEVKQVEVGEIVRYQPGNYHHHSVIEDGVRYIFLTEDLIYVVEDENEKILRALKHRVVFLPDPIKEETQNGIILPQIRKSTTLNGAIVAAGAGCEVQAGDRVIIENKSTWQYYDSSGQQYILTDRSNILALLT